MDKTWKYKDIEIIVKEFAGKLASRGGKIEVIKQALICLPDLLEFLAEELCPYMIPTEEQLDTCLFTYEITLYQADNYPAWLKCMGKTALLPYLKNAGIFYDYLEEKKLVFLNPFKYQDEVFIKQEAINRGIEELQRLKRLRNLEFGRQTFEHLQRTS